MPDLSYMDVEANQFAMEILMPASMLLRDLQKLGGIDMEDDKAMAKFAKRYGVSLTVMAIRMGQISRRL